MASQAELESLIRADHSWPQLQLAEVYPAARPAGRPPWKAVPLSGKAGSAPGGSSQPLGRQSLSGKAGSAPGGSSQPRDSHARPGSPRAEGPLCCLPWAIQLPWKAAPACGTAAPSAAAQSPSGQQAVLWSLFVMLAASQYTIQSIQNQFS